MSACMPRDQPLLRSNEQLELPINERQGRTLLVCRRDGAVAGLDGARNEGVRQHRLDGSRAQFRRETPALQALLRILRRALR